MTKPEDGKGLPGLSFDFPGLSLHRRHPEWSVQQKWEVGHPFKAQVFSFLVWATSQECETEMFRLLIAVVKKTGEIIKYILFNPNIKNTVISTCNEVKLIS